MAEAILTVENLNKSFGDKILFEDLSFGINRGQKVALVGKNGEGKSTLLNLIYNKDEIDGGKVTFNSSSTPSYLAQNPTFDENLSVIDEINKDFIKEKEDPSFQAKVKEILFSLNLDDINKNVSVLSGGERKKLALTKILLKDSDFLLLDEPTNHLDIKMIEWLEDFLLKKQMTLLIITHDRCFIDEVCTDIYELDNSTISKYHGNFEYFLQKKEEKEVIHQNEISKAKNIYTRELEWIRRMPQARGTKSQARIDNFEKIKEKAFQKQEKEQEELSVVERRIGSKILEINNLNKDFEGKTIIKDFSYTFKKGEKIAIVGNNGCGKTTLLNIITGTEKPTNGKITIGQTIQYGYYTQNPLIEKDNKRVIDIIKDVAENIQLSNGEVVSASMFLLRFGFSKVMQYNYYNNLSGGEKRRLFLLKILISNPNFLILDEPTNDLDIYSLMTLEKFLKEFKGCLLFVSHDRRFIENLSEHKFIFEQDGNIKDYYLQLSDYEKEKKQRNNLENQRDNSKNQRNNFQKQRLEKPKKLSFKEKRQKEELEKEIPLLEEKKRLLTEKLSSGTLQGQELLKASFEIETIIKDLDNKETLWLTLCEKEENQ
jgi:ATP-binding cassette subfamily F protein uup